MFICNTYGQSSEPREPMRRIPVEVRRTIYPLQDGWEAVGSEIVCEHALCGRCAKIAQGITETVKQIVKMTLKRQVESVH